MKNFVVFITFLILFTSVYGQRKFLEKNKTYSTARIYQDGRSEKLKVRNLRLSNDSVIEFNRRLGASLISEQRSIKNIRYVAVKKGTHAAVFSASAGGAMLLISLVAVSGATANSDAGYSKNIGIIIAGATLAGAATGALIGVLIPKWKTLSIHHDTSSLSFNLSQNIKKECLGISLSLKI